MFVRYGGGLCRVARSSDAPGIIRTGDYEKWLAKYGKIELVVFRAISLARILSREISTLRKRLTR